MVYPLPIDLERLARAIHEDYVQRGLAQGRTQVGDPSLAPWECLPDALRASNLDQAADVADKLLTISRQAIPVTDAVAPVTDFSDDEVELLGKLEHDRWVHERLEAGWTFGTTKDVDAKRSPYLVPWDELTEETRDLDRDTVRKIPEFLAELGFTVSPPPPSG
jgi:hypothetical protein